jgi:AraC-like DNA-binding protein
MKSILAEGFKGDRTIITPYSVRQYQTVNGITKQLHITHIGYFSKARYIYRKRAEGSDENILIYCEKGRGWIEYGEERHVVVENCFFIIPAGKGYAYGADAKDPWSIYWFHFKGENVHMFDSVMARLVVLDASDTCSLQKRIRLFEEMFYTLDMGYGFENLEYVSFCLMHFMASLKYVAQFGEIRRENVVDVVQKTILYIKDNLEKRICLADLSAVSGYSNSRLNTLFLERTSFSPMQYYNQLRVQRVCNYLQFSDLQVKEISTRLQYCSPYHLSKAFRHEMNMTPREYRYRYKE